MGENPASWWYWNDYMRDMEDEPLEVNGAWIKILNKCHWGKPRGKATLTLEQWAYYLRTPIEKTHEVLQHIFEKNIADFQVLNCSGNPVEFKIVDYTNTTKPPTLPMEPNANICITNRRMDREEKARELNRKRQQRHYYKKKVDGQPNA